MRGFLFIRDEIICSPDTFYARLYPRIQSTKELFCSLYYTCWFPEYFGFNWNALDELIMDYSWIKEKNIIIRHVNLPKIPYKDLVLYINSLACSFKYFTEEDKNVMYVFDIDDKMKVIDILSNNKEYDALIISNSA